MITKWSVNIAQFIRNHHKEAASQEVLVFSITILLNLFLVLVTVLGISAITGHFLNAVVLIIAHIFLRFFSGGVHLPTSTMCNLFSISTMLILIHLPISYWETGFIINLLAFLIVLIYAPTKDIMHLNRLGPKYTIHYKIISLAIVASNFWFQSPVASLAFLGQSISLMPWTYKAVAKLERR